MPRPRRAVRRLTPLVLLAIALALFSGARCYPPDTRVVVFIQGLYTTLDAGGTQSTFAEDRRFATLKGEFAARGYEPGDMLDFSYNGGTVNAIGRWSPRPYDCQDTDRPASGHVAVLEQMLRDYRARHKDAHFTLVGHSLGGYVAFLAGEREAARPDAAKLHIDVVVTLDAPIEGVSADKVAIINLIPCEKTYATGAELAAARQDPATPGLRTQQAAAMAAAGIRLVTVGNLSDCLLNTRACLPGQTWADDSESQFVDGAAATLRYNIASSPLASHDAILAHAAAVRAVVDFVGAP
ncbi:MAG TPA: lipase family protein [Dehalococcoidia bacterium]|nr:lipase family protein [Dehalococcoidia bacterium]